MKRRKHRNMSNQTHQTQQAQQAQSNQNTPAPAPVTVFDNEALVAKVVAALEARDASGSINVTDPAFKAAMAALDAQGSSVQYEKAHLRTVEGEVQARHMTALFLEQAGRYEAAARLRGEDAKVSFLGKGARLANTNLKAKHVVYLVIAGGVTYAIVKGLGYVFKKQGWFGMGEETAELPAETYSPTPM